MGYPTRIYYTESNKALMWDRSAKGESLNEIGRHRGGNLRKLTGKGHTADIKRYDHGGALRLDLLRTYGGMKVDFPNPHTMLSD